MARALGPARPREPAHPALPADPRSTGDRITDVIDHAAFAERGLYREVFVPLGIHPGRFTPTFGHGVDSWMHQIDARPARRLAALREIVTAVRRLLAGETVTVAGEYVTLADVVLDTAPEVVGRIAIAGDDAACAATVQRFAAAGAETVVALPPGDDWREQIEHFGRAVLR